MPWFADLLRRYGHTDAFRKVMPHVAAPVDRTLHRLTGGRWQLSRAVMPVLVLHHTGRRSGRPYTTPLFHVATDGGWVVAATNFGREAHPAWSENLLADPDVRIEVGGRTIDVRARLATEQERAEVWPEFVRSWPAYDTYLETAAHRDVRVFVLEPR